jgi:hypothetical protein
MEEIKVKQCPFCGEEFSVEETESGGFIARHENETCPMLNDGSNGYTYNDPDQLVKEYNTRPLESAAAARIRKGMQGAQPRFSNRGDAPLGGIMIEADKLDLEHHPDAMLITQAPNLLAACVASYHMLLEMGVKEIELESLKNTILNAGGTLE